mgnify:CR=1 FL=1|tara:strand:+ start:112 stop:432 length:321 start_codon:yes stop_codon:yes gene_type:complete
MALAETIFVDKCEVVSFASTYCVGNQKVITLQIRKADIVEKDGVEIARSYHRHTLEPGTVGIGTTLIPSDISGEESLVQSIANAVWTTDAKEAYRSYVVGIRSEGI